MSQERRLGWQHLVSGIFILLISSKAHHVVHRLNEYKSFKAFDDAKINYLL